MKILHICAVGATASALLKPQIDYFLNRGAFVEVACSPGREIELMQKQGYQIHPIQIDRQISPILNTQSIWKLTALMRQQQYDLVHVHTPIAAVLGRIAARLARIKRVVYTSHGFPFHDLSPARQYQFYVSVEKTMARWTDLILSQNHEDIETAQKLGLCPPDKIQYLGNGVDIDRFNRDRLDPTQQAQLRRSIGIPDSANLLIATIGRLTRKKGSGDLIEAVAQLLPQFPHLHVLIIGGELSTDPEPFQTELLTRIRELGLEHHVTLTGIRRDIPEVLGLVDIFTLPTFTHEGLPRSILEAMAMSLPVVATDIRGCREAVLPDRTGFIVPPQNSTQLAAALGKLLADADLRQTFGRNGRSRVEADYDERQVFDRLERFYHQLGITFGK
jgi:glycosyltransferase involved in cell wall biosynthesis